MNTMNQGIAGFLMELSARQTSITQLFSRELLQSIRTHLGMGRAAILTFDENNTFLSWIRPEGVMQSGPDHPYTKFAPQDMVEHVVFHTSRREELTYFNTVPRIYCSSEIISPADYETSAYVRFIEEQFGAHYSATLAFGNAGCIQIVFFKTREEGDFSQDELLELENLYVAVANAYVNFKRHEQAKIISDMKDRVIHSETHDYFITDGFQHVLAASDGALQNLAGLFGIAGLPDPGKKQPWIPILLQKIPWAECLAEGVSREIEGYRFHIFGHEQMYEHGIVERYYLITVQAPEAAGGPDGPTDAAGSRDAAGQMNSAGTGNAGGAADAAGSTNAARPTDAAGLTDTAGPEENLPAYLLVLTPAERRVAVLLTEGNTYKQIAEELVVSYHTVKKHVENIYSKLGISSRYQLYELMAHETKKR